MNVDEIRRIAVIGAGLMGHGIAQELVLAGYDVRLHDVDAEKLEQAVDNMRANLRTLAELGLVTAAQVAAIPTAIRTSTVLADVAADADLAIEAVFENLALKHDVFRQLDRLCPPHAILASNTSSFMPSTLATVTGRQDKMLVAHYFNPPHLIPLVEVVPGAATAAETVDTIVALLVRVGKQPVIVRKEAPGFIGNRLQAALRREALSIVAQGIATPQDVDTVVKTSFGRRLAVAGPFEISELNGLDLTLAIAEQLFPTLESSPEVPAVLRDKVIRGELGAKTGKGFYEWTPEAVSALRQRIGRALIEITGWSRAGRDRGLAEGLPNDA
ncbi:MAG: 3-hydroxyacyl-CoA dehydrogenase family protein [Chloroflexota bacterium]|nr:3-hydroxyacyl-CoA dehydrogenase family protein [Chloroflexota bacterium]